MLALLGDPQRYFRAIHVVGTNVASGGSPPRHTGAVAPVAATRDGDALFEKVEADQREPTVRSLQALKALGMPALPLGVRSIVGGRCRSRVHGVLNK